MNNRTGIRLFTLASRLLVGTVFVFASLDKIHDPDGFSRSILNYRLVDSSLVVLLAAAFIPWIELVAGFCLILGIYRRGSSFLILSLLTIFIIAISQALLRGLDISCGCFTQEPGTNPLGIVRLLQDIVLAILAYAILSDRTPPDTSFPPKRTA